MNVNKKKLKFWGFVANEWCIFWLHLKKFRLNNFQENVNRIFTPKIGSVAKKLQFIGFNLQ